MHANNDAIGQSAARAGRKAWTAPQVVKINAGEAEVGANPIIAEGFFGKGS